VNRFTFYKLFSIKNWIHHASETIELTGFRNCLTDTSCKWWH